MYIYSVTINIDEAIADDWLKWMEAVHIPNMLATGKFFEAKLCQVMIDEEMGGITYSTQYTAHTKTLLDKYYQDDADKLRAEVFQKFGDKIVSFRTELKVLNHVKNFVQS